MRRSFRTPEWGATYTQGCTLGWYAAPRWGAKGNLHLWHGMSKVQGAVHEPPLHQPQITRSNWYDHWPCRDNTNVGAVREPPQILTKRVLFESKMSKVQTRGFTLGR